MLYFHLGLKLVPFMGTLGSKYTHMDTWTLRVRDHYRFFLLLVWLQGCFRSWLSLVVSPSVRRSVCLRSYG